MESLTGKLLVAAPSLIDPNFRRTVIIICRHNDDGAMGVVLNRPRGDVHVIDHLPEWAEHVSSPTCLFIGGPVEPTVGIGLGRPQADGPEPAGLQRVTAALGLVDLSEPPSSETPLLDACRIFAGYAGWSPGQLEAEITEDAWFVVDSLPGDAFTPDPEGLWRTVLRRQPGKLAMFAYFPDDPSQN